MITLSTPKPKRSVISRAVMVFSVLVLVSACSSSDDEELVLDSQGANMGSDVMIDNQGAGVDGVYQGDAMGGPTPGTQQDLVVNVGDRVYFGTDSHTLNAEARSVLDAQAAWLQRYPNLNIVIEGHADERGTREYNIALGERRANATRSYLSALGVTSNRVTTISYGKERPAVAAASPSGWAQNRRTVTKVD